MTGQPTYRHHAEQLLSLGLPLVGAQLAQIGIQLTDTVMLGWYGVEALAALVLAHSVYFAAFILGAGISHAVMPMVAAADSSGDQVQVRRATRMGIWASLAYSALVVPPLMSFGPVFRAMGQPPAIAELAGQYLQVAGPALIPALAFMVARSYLAAQDRAGLVLVVTLVTVALNAGLNWLLIFGNLGFPELGVRGAAIATLLMQTAGAALLLAQAARLRPDHRLLARFWRPDPPALGQVLRLGAPIGLTNLAEVGLFAGSSLLMGLIGTQALAAHGIALQIASVTFMMHIGLSQAATIHAGRAFGRRDREHLRRGALVALTLSGAVVAATIAAFLGVPELLIGLFLSPADPARPEILALGVVFLAAAALFQLADAAQAMALGLLRGVQDTRRPMVLAIVSYWFVAAPGMWVLTFPLGLGGVGIWLGLAIGLACAAATMMLRFWRQALPAVGPAVPVGTAPRPGRARLS